MHSEELKAWIKKKTPKLLVDGIGSNAHAKNAIKRLFNVYDGLRFRWFHDVRSSETLEKETAKLLYSWKTFSKDYLKNRHGQDFEHPSRIKMSEIIGALAKSYGADGNPPKLLEIPFGMGTDYKHYFSKMDLEYTGMELNPKQVEATRETHPDGNFTIGNIFGLEVPDKYYDIVYCRHIFEHLSLQAMENAIQETHRVAKRAIVYVFFSMADIPEHRENKVRQYHVNLLSQSRLKEHILSFERVDNVEVIPIVGYENWRDNTILHIHLKTHD